MTWSSILAARWVMRKSGLPPTESHVLLALIGRAAHDDRNGQIPGTCYPSQARLSLDTRLARSTVNRAIGQLVSTGVISILSGGGTSGQRITYDLRGLGVSESYTPVAEPDTGVAQEHRGGVSESYRGCSTGAQGVSQRATGGVAQEHTKGTSKGTIEGDQEDGQGPAAPQPARISADWTPSEQARSWCRDHALDDEEIGQAAEEFRDYWLARTGVKAKKLDWDAAFRNRIRGGRHVEAHPRFKAKTLPPLKRRKPPEMTPDDGRGRELMLKVARGDMPIDRLPLWDKHTPQIRKAYEQQIEVMRQELVGEQPSLPLAGGTT